jgi:hypothetical protein
MARSRPVIIIGPVSIAAVWGSIAIVEFTDRDDLIE